MTISEEAKAAIAAESKALGELVASGQYQDAFESCQRLQSRLVEAQVAGYVAAFRAIKEIVGGTP